MEFGNISGLLSFRYVVEDIFRKKKKKKKSYKVYTYKPIVLRS